MLIVSYLCVNNSSDVVYCWQSRHVPPFPPTFFCFDLIFELYLGCRPVVFSLITRRKLSIKSVKWNAMSSWMGGQPFVQILQHSWYWQFVFWGHMCWSISGWAQPRWKMKNQIAFAYFRMTALDLVGPRWTFCQIVPQRTKAWLFWKLFFNWFCN